YAHVCALMTCQLGDDTYSSRLPHHNLASALCQRRPVVPDRLALPSAAQSPGPIALGLDRLLGFRGRGPHLQLEDDVHALQDLWRELVDDIDGAEVLAHLVGVAGAGDH